MTDTIKGPPAVAWLHPLAETQSPPLSERLIRGLEAHLADEAHDLVECHDLAARVGDPTLRFVLQLIADDERHHHAVIQSMITRLHEEVEFISPPGESLIPRREAVEPLGDTQAIAATIRTLIRDEHEGARHARHLARQEPGAYGGLFPLLLETIARDSEKHATMLQFVLRNVEHPQ